MEPINEPLNKMSEMEELKKKNNGENNDKEIVYSQAIKAGKRIYYLDVKKNRKDDMFIAITESKKIVSGEGDDSQVSFEKHKIFLYKEDFEKFMNGLQQSINYIHQHQDEAHPAVGEETEVLEEKSSSQSEGNASSLGVGEIKIDIDF